MPTRVVINKKHGGFCVSPEVYKELDIEWDGYGDLTDWSRDKHGLSTSTFECRSDPELIEVLESVGLEAASGRYSKLKIIEIPDDAQDPRIVEYDGIEWVAEGRTWS